MKIGVAKLAVAGAFACALPIPALGQEEPPEATLSVAPIEVLDEYEAREGIDPVRLALADQIIETALPEDRREEMFFFAVETMVDQVKQSVKAREPESDADLDEIFDTWVDEFVIVAKETLRGHIPALIDGMKAGYARTFTEEELRDILAFVSTKSGREFFLRSSEAMADPTFAAANIAYMQDIQALQGPYLQMLVERITEHLESKEQTTSS